MGTTGQSITLANSIIGVGILAMPFCFQQCGILLATLILLFMGLVSRLCCHYLLKSALLARRRNFEFLAFHVFGPAGKLAVEVGIIGFLMGTCIAYFVVVGDLGPQIISKMFNINQSDILRTSIMVIVSLVCVLPLGLLRNVDSLSNVSAATIGFYFCLVMKVISEVAFQLFSGEWPTRIEMWKPSGVLQCVPIFSMALFCQTQLFEIFESLPMLSLEKMNVVTKNAINICTGVYFTLGLFGYIAFCSQEISGNILMSLSPTMASDVIKLGFVMSLAFSFPLIIFPCRASLYSLLYRKAHPPHHDHIINHSIPETTFRCITVAIIAVTLFISLLVPNIELVLGLVGSTIGVMVCLVFPAACFLNLTFKNTNERVLAKAVLVLGLLIMVLGTYANLQAAENTPDKYDERTITQERIDKIVEDFFEKAQKNGDAVKTLTVQNKEANKEDKLIKEVKDSEIQPPNPIPPESNSNEKTLEEKSIKEEKERKESKEKELLLIDETDKASESHPKNLNKPNGAKPNIEDKTAPKIVEAEKLEEKPKQIETQVNQEKTQEKIDIMKQQKLIETIKQHGEEQKELIKEQKEILNEIKKTKDELQQSKKDIDTNEAKKIAVESIQEIAKVAIQSLSAVSDKPLGKNDDKKAMPIEKIANEAVQEIAKKVVETIEAIKDKQEISKDVVANVENKAEVAKEQPSNHNPDQNNQVVPNIQPNPQVKSDNLVNANIENPYIPPINSGNDRNPPVQNVLSNSINSQPKIQNNAPVVSQQSSDNTQQNANIKPVIQNPNPAISNGIQANRPVENSAHVQNIPVQYVPVNNNQAVQNNQLVQNDQLVQNNQPVQNNAAIQKAQVQYVPVHNIQPVQNNEPVQNNQPLQSNEPVQNNIPVQSNQLMQNNQPLQNSQSAQNLPVPNLNVEQKVHSHSPDEPQSYKEGEDSQKEKLNNDIAQNMPIPLAMNGNNQIIVNRDVVKTNKEKENNLDNNNNGAIDTKNSVNNAENKPVINRQKREVVDCTEKNLLKPEDEKICKALLSSSGNNIITDNSEKMPKKILNPMLSDHSQEVLKKVDLNDVLQRLPLETLHHLRSLKSFDETKER